MEESFRLTDRKGILGRIVTEASYLEVTTREDVMSLREALMDKILGPLKSMAIGCGQLPQEPWLKQVWPLVVITELEAAVTSPNCNRPIVLLCVRFVIDTASDTAEVPRFASLESVHVFVVQRLNITIHKLLLAIH